MNILFVSLVALENIGDQGIYNDLLRAFRDHGHNVYAIAPREKRTGLPTEYVCSRGINILRVAVGNIQKTGLIEKGVSTLTVKNKFLKASRLYFKGIRFDLILYTTPPTTVSGLVHSYKKQSNAKAYLLLKDLFPQNSLDLGLLTDKGPMGLVYKYFKRTEKETYKAADWIGCMSPANRDYLLAHEPQLNPNCVEVNPNSITPIDFPSVDKMALRNEYEIPADEYVFAYGGNLGKPQGIDFLLGALELNETSKTGFFVIAGDGTERVKVEKYFEQAKPQHARLLPNLPRYEYESMLRVCDAGLILLDYRFTIPNFPSRLLSYLQAELPVVIATDPICDMGSIAEKAGFGVRVSSNDPIDFLSGCEELKLRDGAAMGLRGKEYLLSNYTAENSYNLIMEHFNDQT